MLSNWPSANSLFFFSYGKLVLSKSILSFLFFCLNLSTFYRSGEFGDLQENSAVDLKNIYSYGQIKFCELQRN